VSELEVDRAQQQLGFSFGQGGGTKENMTVVDGSKLYVVRPVNPHQQQGHFSFGSE